MSRRNHFDVGHGNPEHYNPHTSRWVYIDDEAIPREEIHAEVGFSERTPEYLLQKHKEKQAKKRKL